MLLFVGGSLLRSTNKVSIDANERAYSSVTSGQSYKHFTLVNYDSRVVPDLKILYIAVAVDLNTRQIEAIPCTYEAYLPTSQLKFLGFPPFM